MDTQGCFDDKTTVQENSVIFALSCLLSSVLIFNVKNQITEDVYQYLQLFIGYTRIPNDAEEMESKDEKSFTKLVLLVRDWENAQDFEYGYHDDITSPGPKNFKKEKVDVTHDMAKENAVVRKGILDSFENVACCLMPHPGKHLASRGIDENLDPDFIKAIKNFFPRIFDASNICLKKIDGEKIDGNKLKEIVNEWAKCFDKYDFPQVSNVTEASAKFQNHEALTTYMKIYREKMSNEIKNNVGLSDEKIEKVHYKNKEEAIAGFNSYKRIKHDDLKSQYMEKLVHQIEEAFETYQNLNLIIRAAYESGKKSEEEMKQLKEEMARKMKKLERSQEARHHIMNKQHGYFTVKIVNETENNITLYWKNDHFWNAEKFVIESKLTETRSFYSYDNWFWSTKYRANILYDDKSTEFWAFGDGAPRADNIFKVKSEGIFLNGFQHSSWKDPRFCTVGIINEMDSKISLKWSSQLSANIKEFYSRSEESDIYPNQTEHISFHVYDHVFWKTNCRAIIKHDKNIAEFWIFGETAPREVNTFKVHSDGIFLGYKQHVSWTKQSLKTIRLGK